MNRITRYRHALAALLVLACSETVISDSRTIEVRHELPSSFPDAVRAAISQLEVILDERDGGASLYNGVRAAVVTTTGDGLGVTTEMNDVDSDGKVEGRVTVLENPFGSGRGWSLFLWGGSLESELNMLGKVYRQDGGARELIASASAMALDTGGPIQFGDGLKRVTLAYACAPTIACVADGGVVTDGGTDTTPPETTLDGGPGAYSTPLVSFSFTCSESPCAFACSLDDAGTAPCTSPHTPSSLAEGTHTFFVRATDDAGNTDPTPAQHTWIVDGTRPSSTLALDIDASAVPYGTVVNVTGTASDNLSGVDRVEVSVDAGGDWFTAELDGGAWRASFAATLFAHWIFSRAVDKAGNVESRDGGVLLYTLGNSASDAVGTGPTADFGTNCAALPGGVGLQSPAAVAYDSAQNRLFVADTANNRVLVHNLGSLASFTDYTADGVLGQPDMNRCDLRPPSADSMYEPKGLAYDTAQNRLFVSDRRNNRVLVFTNAQSITSGAAATYVLGQPNFTTNLRDAGAGAMYRPSHLDYDVAGQRLFVADQSNHRVLVFAAGSLSNGQAAANVLGQANFDYVQSWPTSQTTFYQPSGVAYDSTGKRLFVADTGARRVLVFQFDGGIITNGMPAQSLLGQTTWTGNDWGTTASLFSAVEGIAYDTTNRLFVADRGNNRVLVFNVQQVEPGEPAIGVLGQAVFDAGGAQTTRSGLSSPMGLAFTSTDSRLFVADESNNRVVVYRTSPLVNGDIAYDAIGHVSDGGALYDNACPNNPGALGLGGPAAIAFDSVNRLLFVTDVGFYTGYRRVLAYALNDAGTPVDRTPDYVLGQTDMTRCDLLFSQSAIATPMGLALDSARNLLFVSDNSYHRVLVFQLSNLMNGMNAAYVLGQTSFDAGTGAPATTQSGLDSPAFLAFDAARSRLFVADRSNNRVMVFDVSTLSNGMNAAYVLGQPIFDGGTAATTQDRMSSPFGVAHQASTNRLFVADVFNYRILVFALDSIANGMPASYVIGQPDFTTRDGGVSRTQLNWPYGVAVDDARKRLYVADTFANRVVVYDVTSITNGMPAMSVLGQSDFATSDGGTGASALYFPVGVGLDPTGSRLFVADIGNARLLFFDVGP